MKGPVRPSVRPSVRLSAALLAEPPLGVHGGHGSGAGRGDGLAVHRVCHVPRRVHARDRRLGRPRHRLKKQSIIQSAAQ